MNHLWPGKLTLFGAVIVLASSTMLGSAPVRADPPQADDGPSGHAQLPNNVLYVESNIAQANQNSVFGFSRAADGSLTPLPGSPFATNGTGFYDPSFKLGPFDSDQNMVADPRRGVLFVPNGGSNNVSAMTLEPDGGLTPVDGSPFRTRGINPLSLGLNGDHLIIVNGDEDPAQPAPGRHPSFSVASIVGDQGKLRSLPGSQVNLADGSAPGQALTTNTGPFIFTQEFLGGTLRSFVEGPFGRLFQLDSTTPPQESGETKQPLPLGLWAHPKAQVLYVGLTNVSRIGVFSWSDEGRLDFVRSVADPGMAPCWLRVNREGTRLYAINTGDFTIAVFDVSDPENPVLVQNAQVAKDAGALFQFSLSPDEKFLYVLEQASSASAVNKIHVLQVDRNDGTLTENSGALTTLSTPHQTRSVGMVVF